MGRITILRAMTFVALLMIGLAAVCRTSYATAAALLTATLLLLLFASVRAISALRTSWASFAVCGWAYFILHLGPGFEASIGRHGAGAMLADLAYASVGPHSALIAGREGRRAVLSDIPFLRPSWVWAAWNGWENGLGGDLPFCPTTYLRVVHCLMTWATGGLGVVASRSLAGRGESVTRDRERLPAS